MKKRFIADYTIFCATNVYYKNQFGYLLKGNTVEAIAQLSESIRENLDRNAAQKEMLGKAIDGLEEILEELGV